MREALRQNGKWQVASDKRQGFRLEDAGLLMSVFCLLTFGFTGCSPQQKAPEVLQDKPLAAFQTNLLQTAFEMASAMPLNPHIKDRARAQEQVADACFKLDQPLRALQYIDQIPNWRRGLGYANYAFYSVDHGITNGLELLLQKAESIGKAATQEWRTEKVADRIAQVRGGLDAPEAKPGNDIDDSDFETQLSAIAATAASGQFDALQAAMGTCCSLYKKFYGREDLRIRAEEKINGIKDRLPVFIRLQYMKQMARTAMEHKDLQTAQHLIQDMVQMVSDNTWPVEYHVRVLADLAALQAESGDTGSAAATFDNARDLYSRNQKEIVNIDKADTLIPVAESALALGQPVKAVDVYKQAVEAAVENSNSRPRAEDLVAICLSLALNKVEPDEALWSRIKECQSALGDPW